MLVSCHQHVSGEIVAGVTVSSLRPCGCCSLRSSVCQRCIHNMVNVQLHPDQCSVRPVFITSVITSIVLMSSHSAKLRWSTICTVYIHTEKQVCNFCHFAQTCSSDEISNLDARPPPQAWLPQCCDTRQDCNKAFLHVNESLWFVPKIITLSSLAGFNQLSLSSFIFLCLSCEQLTIQAEVCGFSCVYVFKWYFQNYLLVTGLAVIYQSLAWPVFELTFPALPTLPASSITLANNEWSSKQNSIKLNLNGMCHKLFNSLDICNFFGSVCFAIFYFVFP